LAPSLAFLNQIWFLDVRPLSNNPFWSLSYEWWYYAAFGCFTLIPGRAGMVLGFASLAIMGPKIWLLFPVWLMGIEVYRRLQAPRTLSPATAIALFAAPVGVVGVLGLDRLLHLRERIEALIDPHYLAFSIIFIPAILFGALFACNLYAFPSLERYLAPMLGRVERPVRTVAGATLSIYLYHYPLLYFFGAFLHVTPTSPHWMSIAIISCTLLSCFALSTVTESKKRVARRWLEIVPKLLRGEAGQEEPQRRPEIGKISAGQAHAAASSVKEPAGAAN
jgi:peptidoglycan/LPS O-acetylase OafA/YrhL